MIEHARRRTARSLRAARASSRRAVKMGGARESRRRRQSATVQIDGRAAAHAGLIWIALSSVDCAADENRRERHRELDGFVGPVVGSADRSDRTARQACGRSPVGRLRGPRSSSRGAGRQRPTERRRQSPGRRFSGADATTTASRLSSTKMTQNGNRLRGRSPGPKLRGITAQAWSERGTGAPAPAPAAAAPPLERASDSRASQARRRTCAACGS